MMSGRTVLPVVVLLLMAGGAAAWWVFERPADGTAAVNREVIELGRTVYAEHCAACHGVELEGQPDWKRRLPSGRLPAPPHDASGHTWHHGDEELFVITRDGPAAVVGPDYESDMPAFGGVLTDAEIRAVIEYIKSTWPERERLHQQRMTEREQQR